MSDPLDLLVLSAHPGAPLHERLREWEQRPVDAAFAGRQRSGARSGGLK